MPLIAHAISSLVASDFGGEDLNQVLSAHLDSLGISPQAKQNIIPALLGIAKLAKLQSQRSVEMALSVMIISGYHWDATFLSRYSFHLMTHISLLISVTDSYLPTHPVLCRALFL